MNAPLLVVACVALSAGAAFLITYNQRPAVVPPTVNDPAVAGVNPAERIAALEQTMRELETRVRAFDPANVRRAEPAIDEEKLAQAVAARLGLNADRGATGSGLQAASAAGKKESPADAARVVAEYAAQLNDPKLSDEKRAELWKKAKEAGLDDELLASYEERARSEPNSSAAHTELGGALLSAALQAEQGPPSWNLWGRADKSFERALEIDERNWDARYAKAVSLSFWPPALGRGPEAVKHFETLIQQQKDAPQRPDFANTYMFLGNLYAQQGKNEKAMEVWRQGLAAFPDNADLKSKLK